MKAVCPSNPSHKRFLTMAHVSEEWVVDDNGQFIEEGDPGVGEMVAGPHAANTWTCETCHAEAKVTP